MKHHLPKSKQILIPSILFFLFGFILSVEPAAQNIRYEYEDFLKMNNPVRQNLPPGWEYQGNSSNPHGIIVFVAANPRINNIPLQPGDFIGAFYTDDFGQLRCGGADFWLGTENIIFGAFGNDPDTPDKDGFAPAETMYFKVFLQQTQKEYDVDFIQWDPGYFSTNKWYPLGLSAIINLQCELEFDAFAKATPGIICLGDQLTLEAEIFIGTTGNYSYQWSSIPAGFSSNQPITLATPTENTLFILEVSDGILISNHQVWAMVYLDAEVFAGNDQNVCSNQPVQVSAIASNFSGLNWSTSGDGTFLNKNLATTTYFPGSADVSNQTALLTVSVQSIAPCTAEASDFLTLQIQPIPIITVPGALTFCATAPVFVEALVANESAFSWTTSGDGTFDNATQPSMQYFPGSADKLAKTFTLTAYAAPVSPCAASVSKSILVTLSDLPTLNAPASRTICEGSAANVNGIAFNYSSVGWITQGDGTFANANAISTQYFPGAADINAGGTTVTIRAYGTGACGDYYSFRNILIIINKNPVVNAGDDMTVCSNSLLYLNASASYQSSVNWVTSGDGIFSNTMVLNPVYFPGAQDKVNGSVSLTLTANPISPCTGIVSDNVSATLVPQSQVAISPVNVSVCFGDNYSITGGTFNNVSSVWWFTTNGTGSFDNQASLQPAYFPNPLNDYPLGCIVIGVAANPVEPCTAISYAYMSLCFNPPPQVFAGSDQTIISDESCLISDATASHFANLLWQTSGDGTFADASTIQAEYFPGSIDKYYQQAKVFLTAQPLTGCNIAVSDTLLISILHKQSLELPAGLSGFSLFINQENKSFAEVMQQFDGKIVYAKAMNLVYWPEYGINTIGDFSNLKGYIINLEESATTDFTGVEVNDKTIHLQAGWNMLPMLSSCGLQSQFIVDQLGGNLIIISDINGAASIYPANNIATLQTLEPGKSYIIKVAANATLTFPSCY